METRMPIKSWFLAITLGAVGAIVTVVACSDDSPGNADAAVCDCPASEPPLAGRIVSHTTEAAIPANFGGGMTATCPQGETILGGGCRLMSIVGRIVLSQSGIVRMAGLGGFDCEFVSASPVANTGIAEAICLTPAP